jgi:uncharacterized membrane protein
LQISTLLAAVGENIMSRRVVGLAVGVIAVVSIVRPISVATLSFARRILRLVHGTLLLLFRGEKQEWHNAKRNRIQGPGKKKKKKKKEYCAARQMIRTDSDPLLSFDVVLCLTMKSSDSSRPA